MPLGPQQDLQVALNSIQEALRQSTPSSMQLRLQAGSDLHCGAELPADLTCWALQLSLLMAQCKRSLPVCVGPLQGQAIQKVECRFSVKVPERVVAGAKASRAPRPSIACDAEAIFPTAESPVLCWPGGDATQTSYATYVHLHLLRS